MAFTKSLILIAALTVLLAPQTFGARTPETRVLNICKPTTNPKLCYDTIIPEVGPKFDLYNALEIEVAETHKQVMKTAGAIASAFLTPGTSKSAKDSFSTCKEQYSSIVDDLSKTNTLVAQRNVIEARYKVSGVISMQQSCNDEFENGASPFAADSQAVFDLAGNCLDLMKAILDKESLPKGTKA